MAMSGFFTLLAENVIVILGFAIYGILVYYMVAKTIRRNSGKKPRGSSGKKMGRNKTINDQDSTEADVFFTMFRNIPGNRKMKNIPERIFPETFPRPIPTGIGKASRIESGMMSGHGQDRQACIC